MTGGKSSLSPGVTAEECRRLIFTCGESMSVTTLVVVTVACFCSYFVAVVFYLQRSFAFFRQQPCASQCCCKVVLEPVCACALWCSGVCARTMQSANMQTAPRAFSLARRLLPVLIKGNRVHVMLSSQDRPAVAQMTLGNMPKHCGSACRRDTAAGQPKPPPHGDRCSTHCCIVCLDAACGGQLCNSSSSRLAFARVLFLKRLSSTQRSMMPFTVAVFGSMRYACGARQVHSSDSACCWTCLLLGAAANRFCR